MKQSWKLKQLIINIVQKSSGRVVLGLLSASCKLFQNTYEGTINSSTIIDFLDQFYKTITKRTVIVLDNASIQQKTT